jgi:hypothetical protein
MLTSNADGRSAHASNDDDATTPSLQSRFGQQKQPRPAQSARLAKSRKHPSLTARRPPSLRQFESLSLSFGANQCQDITRKNYGRSTTATIQYDEQIVRIIFQQRKISHMKFVARYLSGHAATIMDCGQKLQNKSPWPELPAWRPRGLLGGLDGRVTAAPVSARAPTRPSENSISKAMPALTAVAVRNG